MIHPVGDRLLVKIVKLTEKKIGNTVLTLSTDMKKKYQPECCKALVIAGGSDVPAGFEQGSVILMRSDAGVGLTAEIVTASDARLFRVIEYPEVIASIEENKEISEPNDVCRNMEVIS